MLLRNPGHQMHAFFEKLADQVQRDVTFVAVSFPFQVAAHVWHGPPVINVSQASVSQPAIRHDH